VPRIFNENDKERIREALLEKAKELISRHGLKKTTVEELADAAGIAKGTFYHFFGSKEELCFALMGKEEAVRERLFDEILKKNPAPRDVLRALFNFITDYVKSVPLIVSLRKRGELNMLYRKIPLEDKERHFNEDDKAVLALLRRLPGGESIGSGEARVLSGLFRAVAMTMFHEEDIGADVYQEVLELLGEFISCGLTQGEGGTLAVKIGKSG
jgi:AcrR family transcriptional regulator